MLARARSRPIIPLLLSGDPFFSLSDLPHYDATDGRSPSADFVDRLRELSTPHGSRLPGVVHSDLGTVRSVCFSPDGTRLIAGCKDGLGVWSSYGGWAPDTTRARNFRGVTDVACTPDGTTLAVSGERAGCVWCL